MSKTDGAVRIDVLFLMWEVDELILKCQDALRERAPLAAVKDLEKRLYSVLKRLEQMEWGSRKWKDLPTPALVRVLLEGFQVGQLDVALKIGRYTTTELAKANDPHLINLMAMGEDPYRLFSFLHRVGTAQLHYSLWQELECRLLENEDPNGRRVREFLVHRNKETLDPVLHLILWCTTQAVPHDEKLSVAAARLVEVLAEYPQMKVVALDPKGLEALAEGRFNKALWRARGRVRHSLGKEAAFQNRRSTATTDSEVLLSRNIQPPDANIAAIENRVFLEKLMQHLTPRQCEFLEIRRSVDTDKEVAEKMGVSNGRVSQLRSGIEETVQELLSKT